MFVRRVLFLFSEAYRAINYRFRKALSLRAPPACSRNVNRNEFEIMERLQAILAKHFPETTSGSLIAAKSIVPCFWILDTARYRVLRGLSPSSP